MADEERQLWRVGDRECVMISCCSGAELQMRQNGAIVLREMYPMKSDLYERARELKSDHEGTQSAQNPQRESS